MNVDSLSLSSLGNRTRSVPPSHVEYCRCGLMWVGLDWWEDPDWFFGGGREAWLQERFWWLSDLEKFTEVVK
ncbi:hypothetical protein TNCV_3546821 [Trichonephila clavipes]|nr:hypothetical protein TNCV_3546821 [Trichonephila clavipes]